jgi:hypothetical protein
VLQLLSASSIRTSPHGIWHERVPFQFGARKFLAPSTVLIPPAGSNLEPREIAGLLRFQAIDVPTKEALYTNEKRIKRMLHGVKWGARCSRDMLIRREIDRVVLQVRSELTQDDAGEPPLDQQDH